MKSIVVAAIIFTISTTVFAMGEMEIRDRWAKSIAAIKKVECRNESKNVLGEIDFAATMVFHGEYEDTKHALENAHKESQSQVCKDAIIKNRNAPR